MALQHGAMSTRTTKTQAVPTAPKRTARPAVRTKASASADELADGLGKLAITKPEPKARATEASLTTASAGPSKTSDPSNVRRPADVVGKGKEKATSLEESLPWACSAGTTLRPGERAMQAMQCVNLSIKSLSQAEQAGYRYGSPLPKTGGTGKEDSGWTDEKVDKLLDTCEKGFEVLRELDGQRILGNKGPEVERSCQGMIMKCLNTGTTKRAMTSLLKARPALLRLYQHAEISTKEKVDPPKAQAPSRTTTASGATGRPASTLTSARSRSAPSSSVGPSRNPTNTAHKDTIPPLWIELTSLPAPKEGTDIPDPIKNLLLMALTSAWIGCIYSFDGANDLISTLPTPPNTRVDRLNPLEIARSLPRNIITPTLFNFYRAVSALSITPDSHVFLHLRHLSLIALALTITSSPDSKNTPTQLWETTHRVISSAASAASDGKRLREATDMVESLVDWVENQVNARGEARKDWFSGKGWSGLMDVWIAVARKLGDSDIIDRALNLLTASTSIACSSQADAVPTAEAISEITFNAPIEEVTRIRGDLAKASLLLDKILESPTPPEKAADHVLDIENLSILAQVINMLPPDEDSKALVDRAVRASERVRRGCMKVLDRHGANKAWEQLVGEAERWSRAAIDLAEAVADRIETDTNLANFLIAGTIDTVVFLSQRSPPSAIALIVRGYELCQRTKAFTQPEDHISWVRCLSAAAYNVGGRLYIQNRLTDALPLIKCCCEWAAETIPTERAEPLENKGLNQLLECMAKRWEFLAGCYQKAGDKKAVFGAYAQCLASQPPSLLSALSNASSQPLSTILEAFPEFNNTLLRLAAYVFYDPTLARDFGKSFLDAMGAKGCQPGVIGAIGERLMDVLEEGAWKREVGCIVLDLGEGLLDVYSEAYPIRKLRVLGKMMNIILTSGQRLDQFQSFLSATADLSNTTDLKCDSQLRTYQKEYHAYILILRALWSYHLEGDPSAAVVEHSKEVVQVLRAIIIPPTATPKKEGVPIRKKQPLRGATTTRAANTKPARGAQRTVSEPETKIGRKVVATRGKIIPVTTVETQPPEIAYDDIVRLTRLLGSLSSLLGLLGQGLAQIEMLKLLRAFQRNREDLVDDYVRRSGQLATEYYKLGKTSRAGFVFVQSRKTITEGKMSVDTGVKVELLLRWCCFLAGTGDIIKARELYIEAQDLNNDIEVLKGKSNSLQTQIMSRCETLERTGWARCAVAAISAAQDNATEAIMQLSAAFRLWTRAADAICRIAETEQTTPSAQPLVDDPFTDVSNFKRPTGADELSKDEIATLPAQASHFKKKHLSYSQWHVASSLLDVTFDLASAFAARGSVKDVEYFLKVAGQVSAAVKSGGMGAKTGVREAEVMFRLRKYDELGGKLESAAALLCMEEGPEVVDLMRLQGDLYSRQEMAEEAEQVFESTSNELAGLDAAFTAMETLLPTPKKKALNTSIVSRKSLPSPRKSINRKEPLLPVALAHVLRQHAWLLREAGSKEECEQLLVKIKSLPSSTQSKAEDLLLQGKIALHEAFNQFKTDLFMSSLTESAVAMPMGTPEKKVNDRQSTRLSIRSVLARAEDAFLSALEMVSGTGKVEGIRQACLALALLKAFQTSLGQGSTAITAAAASVLASSSAITLHRELLQAIQCKFVDIGNEDVKWPLLASPISLKAPEDPESADDLDDHDGKLRSYWDMIKAKYSANPLLTTKSISLDSLPSNWAVISINVSDDRNTMFISRHQKNHEPIVFCLPIDRQGRRDGDEGTWTFDLAIEELETIIKASNEGARRAKSITTTEGKADWWTERRALDKRMEELCVNLEFVWLGAFKTILSPRNRYNKPDLEDLRSNLEKVFQPVLADGRNKTKKTPTKLHLDDALLECFASLSGKCKEDEVEDLIYFILDIYQFHGVPVALSELDLDAIGVDVKGALEKIELKQNKPETISNEEHILLALDKNVQSFPWESIPILRGRPVSRIPSLSFLLDQVAMGHHLRPSLTQSIVQSDNQLDTKRTINSRRTYYILNPSGDLKRTEAHFKPWIDEMVRTAGWKGIVGRAPTELEMKAALRDYDLILYFGHGGAEQYITSHKIRSLPQCATTMLWGCSSGHLKDQGDFDRTGTAWHYMVAGCPSLVGNLWDVTDRDIDRLSEHVLKQGLHLDAAHQPQSRSRLNTLLPLSDLSVVQAVNKARDECKLKYLNGAAPVVYGLPVYLH